MPFTLAVDFDQTLFNDSIPNSDVIKKVREFKKAGAEIALWTCREGTLLEEAISLLKNAGLKFDSINENTPSAQKFIDQKKEDGIELATRKIMTDFYVDDKACNIQFFLNIDVKETCAKFADR